MGKKLQNDVILDPASDEPLKANAKGPGQGDLVDMTLGLGIRDFCKLVFPASAARGGQGGGPAWNYHSDMKAVDRLLRCVKKANAAEPAAHLPTVMLDQADWDWITKKVEEHGAAVFGANTAAFREALDREVKDPEPAPAKEPAKT